MNRYVTVCAPAPRAGVFFSALTILAMCCFSADANAVDVITVTSVTDTVRVKGLNPDTSPFDLTNSSNSLSGTGSTLSVSITPPGVTKYESRLTSQYPSLSLPNIVALNTDYEHFMPFQAANAPTSLISGSTSVIFTANTSLITAYNVVKYWGLDPNWNLANARTSFTLFDITNNNQMHSETFGKLNGVDFNTVHTPANGVFVMGNQYRWESSYQLDNNGLTGDVRGVGGAYLELSAVTPVPEPSTIGLLSLAAIGIAFRFRRAR